GTQVAQGHLLAYFILLTLTSILAMFLLGEALVHDATGKFAAAGGLIPLAAGAMTMPALYRTVNSMTIFPNGRRVMAVGILIGATSSISISMLIIPRIGIYGPPTAIMLAFGGPLLFISVRSQLSNQPIEVPYFSLLRAILIAVAIALFFQ